MIQTPTILSDFSALAEEDRAPGEWAACIAAINAGHVVLVPEWLANYFRDVLPPRAMFRGGFTFCEGEDFPELFFRFDRSWVCLKAISDTRPEWYGDLSTAETIARRTDMTRAWSTEYRAVMIQQMLTVLAEHREANSDARRPNEVQP